MIEDNIGKIRQRITLACSRIDRNPDEIEIVAVSKGRTVEQIIEATKAGITNIGENKVQEAVAKYNQLSAIRYPLSAIRWHLIGHLQTNKVKQALRIFDMIHSVDSIHLAQEINRQASKINKVQDILIEIKTSLEETKAGLKPDDTIEVIKELLKLNNINIKGLMTIAPMVEAPEKARPYFRLLRELRDKINDSGVMSYKLGVLSMGMTDDFEVAIEEGSTMVRLGRAIFGEL